MTKTIITPIALVASFLLTACGPVFDNTLFEANREQRANTLAGRACERYALCNEFAAGQTYQTRVDCEADYKAKSLAMWPSDKCGSGQINDAKFATCSDRVNSLACSQNFFDAVVALTECNAATVCSDPRKD